MRSEAEKIQSPGEIQYDKAHKNGIVNKPSYDSNKQHLKYH